MVEEPLENRLGVTFHRTFPLSLPAISQVLEQCVLSNGDLSAQRLREATSLGTIYVEAMPRYARGCGLVEMGGLRPTGLGRLVYERDPNLRDETTLWLMHYHLSAPHGPGPAFWSRLVTHHLPFSEGVAIAEISRDVAQFVQSQLCANTIAERTVRSTTTVFIGSYSKPEALGRLGFLSMDRARNVERVIVSEPKEPPTSIVGYALADFWEASYPDRVTLDLSVLLREHGFARVLWTSPRHLETALDALRVRGVIDVLRSAPPYQVTRLWKNKAALLGHVYA